jgi:hypothetical protein
MGEWEYVAVALASLEAQKRSFISRRVPKIKLDKFFGKCEMPDGSVTILVAKATCAIEACKKLHKGYRISVVMDILTEAEMPREWQKIKPSLIQRSQLR